MKWTAKKIKQLMPKKRALTKERRKLYRDIANLHEKLKKLDAKREKLDTILEILDSVVEFYYGIPLQFYKPLCTKIPGTKHKHDVEISALNTSNTRGAEIYTSCHSTKRKQLFGCRIFRNINGRSGERFIGSQFPDINTLMTVAKTWVAIGKLPKGIENRDSWPFQL